MATQRVIGSQNFVSIKSDYIVIVSHAAEPVIYTPKTKDYISIHIIDDADRPITWVYEMHGNSMLIKIETLSTYKVRVNNVDLQLSAESN
jgi:hypothetical protein